MRSHLVWDWNGTLLDDLDAVVAATNDSLVHAGGRPLTVTEYLRGFTRPIDHYYATVLGRPVSFEEFAELDRIFHDSYYERLPSLPLAAGALEALGAWPRQSLLSMWFHDELLACLAERGLSDYFLRVDGLRASVGGGSKTAHLVEHLAAMEVAGSDCVLIGDSLDDADAAAAVGARCVLYSGGFTDLERLEATGHPVASTLVDAVRAAALL